MVSGTGAMVTIDSTWDLTSSGILSHPGGCRPFGKVSLTFFLGALEIGFFVGLVFFSSYSDASVTHSFGIVVLIGVVD